MLTKQGKIKSRTRSLVHFDLFKLITTGCLIELLIEMVKPGSYHD